MVKETKLHVNKDGDRYHYLPSETKTFYDGFQHLKGVLHREDGPACEYINGTKLWWINDLLHREDGPAIIRADGTKEWLINHKKLSYEEWFEWVMTYSSPENQMNVLLKMNQW